MVCFQWRSKAFAYATFWLTWLLYQGHPKTREELWDRAFNGERTAFDQTPSLVFLLDTLARRYLRDCVPVILYDSMVEHGEDLLLQQLFKKFPLSFFHGRIGKTWILIVSAINFTFSCENFIILIIWPISKDFNIENFRNIVYWNLSW